MCLYGCSKNLVDTEMCIGLFKNEKFNIVHDSKKADIIVINTYGFIESPKQEAISRMNKIGLYKPILFILLIASCLGDSIKP